MGVALAIGVEDGVTVGVALGDADATGVGLGVGDGVGVIEGKVVPTKTEIEVMALPEEL